MDATKSIKGGYRAGDNTRRLIYSMVLIPIVPALAGIGVELTAELLAPFYLDDVRTFNLLSALFWVTTVIAIWRKVIIWTLGQRLLTAMVSLIPFVQVVYGQALWDSGCMKQELRASQFQVGVGVWIWVSVWVWWTWERRSMNKVSDSVDVKSRRLSENVARIMASLGLLPAMFGVFFILAFASDEIFGIPELPAIIGTYTLCAMLMIAIWLWIWWRAVVWSSSVLLKSILSGMILMMAPSLSILLVSRSNNIFETLAYFTPIIGWGLWMAGTVRYWPMKVAPGVNGLTPKCLQCGYLLTGLRGTRCPECGDEPTLDELWAATAGDGL